MAERVGVPVDDVVEVFRLLGVAVSDVDDLMFDEREIQLIELMEYTGVAIPMGMGDEVLRRVASGATPAAIAELHGVTTHLVGLHAGVAVTKVRRHHDDLHQLDLLRQD